MQEKPRTKSSGALAVLAILLSIAALIFSYQAYSLVKNEIKQSSGTRTGQSMLLMSQHV